MAVDEVRNENNFIISFLDSLIKATQHVDAKSEFLLIVDGVCLTATVSSQEASLALGADANATKSASRYNVYLKPSYLKEEKINSAFYCKPKSKDGNVAVPEVVSKLTNKLTANKYGPYHLPVCSNINAISIKVDNSLKLIIVQSELYQTLRQAAEEDKSFETFYLNGEALDPKLAHALLEYFRQESYTLYRNLQLALKQKFSNRLFSTVCRKFYQIEYTFVLTLVDYAYVYNPLRATRIQNLMKQTALVKYANSRQSRCLKITDSDGTTVLSGYLLTSRELSSLLGLKQMFRFNSIILYDLIVGQLDSNLVNFPNRKQECFVCVSNDDDDYTKGTKAMYTAAEYNKKLLALQQCVDNPTTSKEDRELAEKTRNFLAAYKKSDTLGYYLSKNLIKIVKLSPSYINKKNMKASKLYEIVAPMSLI